MLGSSEKRASQVPRLQAFERPAKEVRPRTRRKRAYQSHEVQVAGLSRREHRQPADGEDQVGKPARPRFGRQRAWRAMPIKPIKPM